MDMDAAYLRLLHLGLILLRNSLHTPGHPGSLPLAELLHEVPSLIETSKRGRHEHLLQNTVPLFQETLAGLEADASELRESVELMLDPSIRDLEAAFTATFKEESCPSARLKQQADIKRFRGNLKWDGDLDAMRHDA